MFNWTEQELNVEQSAAVMTSGSVFLIACPGSGKTRTLTYKIAHELSLIESTRKFVVAITYTHRAADEIKDRIEGLGVNTNQLWVGTIHSFCLEWIIKPYGIYEPNLSNGYRIIDYHEREKILEGLCAPHKNPNISIYDCDYYFTSDGYRLSCQDSRKHGKIKLVLSNYFKILKQNKQIDFELILWYARKIIFGNPIIGNILSNLIAIILVDEYQDTKQIQYEILASIIRSGKGKTRLFMVGDPNQAIYGSLGGYPIAFDELSKITGIPISELALSLNYRSSRRIIEYFSKFKVQETAIAPADAHCSFPSKVSYDRKLNRDDLVSEIARIIRHSTEILGIPRHEICVLAPQWVHLASMTRQLVVNMPEYDFNGPGLVPFARDTENFWYKVAKIALSEPSPVNYVRRLRWAADILSDLSETGVSLPGLTRKNLLRECNSISINHDDGLNYLKSFFDEFTLRLAFRIEDFSQLEEHHTAFFESSEARISRLKKEGVADISGVEYFKKVFQNRSGIMISTIHGVKGGEFDVVIAYALLEGMVPHFNDTDGDTSAKKLLYVIGSRARKHLHLFSENGRKRGYNGHYSATVSLTNCAFEYDAT